MKGSIILEVLANEWAKMDLLALGEEFNYVVIRKAKYVLMRILKYNVEFNAQNKKEIVAWRIKILLIL